MCLSIEFNPNDSRVSIDLKSCDPSPTDRPSPVPLPKAESAPALPVGHALPEGGAPAVSNNEKRRILLLEEDVTISGMLQGAGFSLSVTGSGLDALKEIMAADFTAILCDMSIPGMSGNVLYRAVERARPHLCQRFICMTERPTESAASGLLTPINGHILFKPVDLEELMDVLTFVETRTQLIECLDERHREGEAENAVPFRENMMPPVAAVASTAGQAEGRRSFSRTTIGIFIALVLIVAGDAVMLLRDSDTRKRADGTSSELAVREGQWTEAVARLEELGLAQQKLAAVGALINEINTDRKSIRWTTGIQSVATSIGANIELKGFTARDNPGTEGGFALRLSGVSSAAEPRKTADQFRVAFETNLKQRTRNQAVQTGFDNLEASPPMLTKLGAQSRAVFTISATSVPLGSGGNEQKGLR